MAIYKIKRKNFSHVSADRPDNHYLDVTQKFSIIPEPSKNCLSAKGAIIGAAVLSGLIALIQHFFEKKNNKYKANPDAFKGQVSDVAAMIRLVITLRLQSPNLYYVMQILGVEEVKRRLQLFI